MSGGGSKQTSTSTQEVQYDPRIVDMFTGNARNGLEEANNLPGPYGGARMAPLNGIQHHAVNNLIQAPDVGMDWLNQAGSRAADLAGPRQVSLTPARAGGVTSLSTPDSEIFTWRDIAAPQVSAPQIASTPEATAASIDRRTIRDVAAPAFSTAALQPYLNPYEDQVVQGALGDIELQRRRALAGNSSDLTAGGGEGAWNGARAGVADALTNEAFGRQAAQTAAQLRSQGFDRAAELWGHDADRGMSATSRNAEADLQVAGRNAEAAGAASQFNAGQAAARAIRQAELAAQAAGANQSASMAGQEANQRADLERARTIYGGTLQTGLFNAGEINRIEENNAQRAQQAMLHQADLGAQDLARQLEADRLLAQLAGQKQQQWITGGQAELGAGNVEQAQAQAELQALMDQWNETRNWGVERQQLRNSSLPLLQSIVQTGQTTNGTSRTSTSPGLFGLLGGGLKLGPSIFNG